MTTITYETETCSRCGGCGQYSYCEMYGTTCLKCRGKGKQYTRRAAKAVAAVKKFKERYNRRADELAPGDLVKYDNRYRTVKTTGLNGLVSRSRINNSAWIERPQFAIEFQGLTYITSPNAAMEVRFTADQFRTELLPFAKTLKGVIIT